MTNWQRWQEYTSGLASPQNYVDWGFVYLITASLQRRVWLPPAHRKLYPNIYPILVGKPGIGKGMLIRYISEILNHHKIENSTFNKARNPEEQKMLDMLAETQREEAKANKESNIIPMGADAVTYERLTELMTQAIGRINYHITDPETGKEKMKVYTHSSLCFCIEELASLFKKNTEALVAFLIQAYDCADNYKKETKGQGIDRIMNLCLNFLGGTNPDFIKEIFDDRLVSGGFSSRIFFIHAIKNRKSVCFLPELTSEQEMHKKHLLDHVLALTKLYGQVKVDQSILDWMQSWWSKFEQDPTQRVSKSPKLEGYYSRKNIHVMKVAVAKHFMESTDMDMTMDDFEWALDFTNKEEKTMHLALTLESDTPLAKASHNILQCLQTEGDMTFISLLGRFWPAGVRKEDLTEILQTLQDIGHITTEQKTDSIGDKVMWYKIKR